MFNFSYICILFAVFVIALGQVAFKYAAGQIVFLPSQSFGAMLRVNIVPISLVALALFFYLISTIAWVQALRTVPLSIAFMFNSISFVLVPLAGFALFGEPVPRFFLPGFALIAGGLFLVSRG